MFAWKGETLEDYWDCTNALTWPDGSVLIKLLTMEETPPFSFTKVELENGSDWVNCPSDNHEEQVVKNLLKKTLSEKPGHWGKVAKGVVGVSKKPQPGYTD